MSASSTQTYLYYCTYCKTSCWFPPAKKPYSLRVCKNSQCKYNQQNIYQCGHCHQSFVTSKPNFTRHCKGYHGISLSDNRNLNSIEYGCRTCKGRNQFFISFISSSDLHHKTLCNKCETPLYICIQCKKKRSNSKDLRRCCTCISNLSQLKSDQSTKKDETACPYDLSFGSFEANFHLKKKQLFFYQNANHFSGDGGRRGIAMRSFQHSRGTNIRGGYIEETDLELYASELQTNQVFQMARLAVNSTANRIQDLGVVMRDTILLLREESEFSRLNFGGITIPMTIQDFNRYFLRNRNSLLSALPLPRIVNINGHACVSLNDQISHAMAHGIEMAFYDPTNENNKGLNSTSAMRRMYQRIHKQPSIYDHTKVGYILLWSDGYQAAALRDLHGSLWLLTATISPPTTSKIATYHTFIMSVGSKKAVHREVVEYYLQECREMSKGVWRFCGRTKSWIHTAFDMLVYVADRPEREEIVGIRKGSKYGNQAWGYSMKVNEKTFGSCETCAVQRRRWMTHWSQELTIPASIALPARCGQCCDWNLVGDTRPFQHAKPANFPKTSMKHKYLKLPKKRHTNIKHWMNARQSFKFLVRAAHSSIANLHRKEESFRWKPSTADCLMQSAGINDKTMTQIKVKAAKTMSIPRRNGERRDVMRTRYRDLGIPILWLLGYCLHQFVNSPLHQVFMGVGKDLIKLMEMYLAHFSKRASFLRDIENIMLDIRSMQLKFCRLNTFSSTDSTPLTSGWLCDNFVAFTRIMPALFVNIFQAQISRNSPRFEDARFKLAQALIVSGFVMMSLLMSPEQVSTEVLLEHVKTFLSFCKKYTDVLVDAKETPFWKSKPNFLSLLNLPPQIKEYGPVHLVNELNYEREIKVVKKLTANMRDSDSCRDVKLRRVKQREVLDLLYEKHKDYATATEEEAWFEFENDERGHNFIVYNKIEDVRKRIKKGKPLVAINFQESPDSPPNQYVAIKKHKKAVLVRLNFREGGQGMKVMGLHYDFITIDETMQTENSYPIKQLVDDFKEAVLYIPYLGERKDTKAVCYTAFSTTWKVRCYDGQFRHPTIPIEFLNLL